MNKIKGQNVGSKVILKDLKSLLYSNEKKMISYIVYYSSLLFKLKISALYFLSKVFVLTKPDLAFSLLFLQQMWKCKYVETSAKEGTNVNELFEELLKLETSRTLSLQPIEETDKKKSGKKGKCNLM